jgi:nitroreductase
MESLKINNRPLLAPHPAGLSTLLNINNMAKIKFANGVTVNFDGNPTPEDVEEVAQKMGLTQTAPQAATAQQPGFLKRMTREVLKTPAQLAAQTETGARAYPLEMAAALLAAAPTLLVYLLAGRHFTRGLIAGAVKG